MCPEIILFGHQILVYDLMLVLGYCLAAGYFFQAGVNLKLSKSWLIFILLSGFLVQLYGGILLPFFYRKFILHQNPAFTLLQGCPGRYFHSSFLAILSYFVLISFALKWPVKKILDNLIFSTLIMSAIGRIGCLAQGCCIGKPSTLPWAIKFPFSPTVAVHPTQAYMFFSELAILLMLALLRTRRRYDGEIFWTGVFFYSLYRFTIEFFRVNPVFLYGLTPAQVFSIITLSISGLYLYCKRFGLAQGKQAFVVWPLALGLILFAPLPYLGILLLVIAMAAAFFFRDPERNIPSSAKTILSPADGRITEINFSNNAPMTNGPYCLISIYLSLFNVHVNRAPVSGVVESITHSPGKFNFAFSKNAAAENENNLIAINNGTVKIWVKQIAGKLTRKIRCYCKPGDTLKQGDRIGMIEFGSCVQIYIPKTFKIRVKTGEKVFAGETVLAGLGE